MKTPDARKDEAAAYVAEWGGRTDTQIKIADVSGMSPRVSSPARKRTCRSTSRPTSCSRRSTPTAKAPSSPPTSPTGCAPRRSSRRTSSASSRGRCSRNALLDAQARVPAARRRRPQTRLGALTLTYRAAIIGLGHTGSTFDDEEGQFSRWQAPHARGAATARWPASALLAGADPPPVAARGVRAEVGAPARSTSTPTPRDARTRAAGHRQRVHDRRGRAPRSWARSRALPG